MMNGKKILLLLLLANALFSFLPIILYFPINIWGIRPLAKIIIFTITYINLYQGRLWARLIYLFFSIINFIYFIALLPLQFNTLKINLTSFMYFSAILTQLITCYALIYRRDIKNFLTLQSKK